MSTALPPALRAEKENNTVELHRWVKASDRLPDKKWSPDNYYKSSKALRAEYARINGTIIDGGWFSDNGTTIVFFYGSGHGNPYCATLDKVEWREEVDIDGFVAAITRFVRSEMVKQMQADEQADMQHLASGELADQMEEAIASAPHISGATEFDDMRAWAARQCASIATARIEAEATKYAALLEAERAKREVLEKALRDIQKYDEYLRKNFPPYIEHGTVWHIADKALALLTPKS